MISCELTIERDSSMFPVTVLAGNPEIGYYEGDTPKQDEPYRLTPEEADEARSKLSESFAPDVEPEPAPAATRREDDAAASAHFGFLGMQSDRRAR